MANLKAAPAWASAGLIRFRLGILGRLVMVDRAVMFSGVGNVVAALLGAMNTVLIASLLSPAQQGIFYVFGSLATIYVFLEFGIGQTVVQAASHEWARVATDRGRDESLKKLAALGRISVTWYALCSGTAAIAIGAVSYMLLGGRNGDLEGWLAPWALLCAGSALNILVIPVFLFIQVVRPPAVFWLYRLVYQVVYGLALGGFILAVVSGPLGLRRHVDFAGVSSTRDDISTT
jgi:hypothetical protein